MFKEQKEGEWARQSDQLGEGQRKMREMRPDVWPWRLWGGVWFLF